MGACWFLKLTNTTIYMAYRELFGRPSRFKAVQQRPVSTINKRLPAFFVSNEVRQDIFILAYRHKWRYIWRYIQILWSWYRHDTYHTAIKNAKPAPDKAFKLQDEKGMYLLVNSNGSKYFRYNYRFGGKRKTFAFGTYPETSLKEHKYLHNFSS